MVHEYRFDEELAVEYLNNYIKGLKSDVCAIFATPTGDLLRTSNDAADNGTQCVDYIPLGAHELPPGISTICRSELEELDRLGGNVDLVSYYRLWPEMQLWMRLPAHHPNIVPFNPVVVNELDDHVVGFTSQYIPGGTLDRNKNRVFKLKYLKDLIQLIDELNGKYSVSHQDVASRNLPVDETTDNIMLFDFNFSARLDQKSYWENRNDVKGLVFTVYEIITGNFSLRSVPFKKQNMNDVTSMGEWVLHSDTRLDHPGCEYRTMVEDWAAGRPGTNEAASFWPALPERPVREYKATALGEDGAMTEVTYSRPTRSVWRADEERHGRKVLRWERPPLSQLAEGSRLLATGKLLSS